MNTPLLGIVGYSGTGKTTLLKALIPLLSQCGLRVGLIKHSHHNVDVDSPGKDSYELRHRGAGQTMVVCDQRWALMTETPASPPSLNELAQRFTAVDVILVEGFKQEPIPKIALYRAAVGKPLANLIDAHVLALACDSASLPMATTLTNLPIWDLNQPDALATFILNYLKDTP